MGMFDGTSAQEMQDRIWEFEEFQTYIKQEGKKWGNSPQFKAVVSAMNTYSKLYRKEITPESAIQIVNANDDMIKACEEYIKHKNEQQVSGKKKELSEGEHKRIAALQALQEFQKGMNFAEVRDMRTVRALAGKTWDAEVPFKTPEAVLQGKAEVSGANASERIKLEVDGRKGFFTKENTLDANQDHAFKEMLDQTNVPERKEVFEKNREIFDYFTQSDTSMPRKIESPNNLRVLHFKHYMYSRLEKLEPDDPNRKAYEELLNTEVLDRAKVYFSGLQERGLEGKEEQKAYFDEYCNNYRKNSPESIETLKKYENVIHSMPLPDYEEKVSSYQMKEVEVKLMQSRKEFLDENKKLLEGENKDKKETLEKIRENQEKYEDYGRLLEDKQGIRQLTKAAAKYDANLLSLNFIDLDKKEMEVSSRNIATSRMAELMGIGDIVAHSEKMMVKSGDTVMSGCFMEFAKGIDPSSADPREIKKLNDVEFSLNPSFLKDMTNMEVLDYLCNQTDRHFGNMFYKLSEPDAQGKRNVIGIQGIDNDLAFGSFDYNYTRMQSRDIEKDLIFIDKSLADRMKKMDARTIDYALGDILPEHQVNLVKERLATFKEHLKENMVELDGDQWELKEYSMDAPEDKLDKRGQKYVKGLKSIQNDLGTIALGKHKITQIRDAVKDAREKYQEITAREEKMYEGVRNIFDEPMPEKQTKEPEKQTKEPEKQVQEPQTEAGKVQKQEQAETKEPKKQAPPLPSRRKVGLGQFEKQTPQAPMIGRGRPDPNKTNTAQQEKKAENPQRVQSGFQKLAGTKPAAAQRKSLIGNHQKQAELKQEKGRSLG